MLADSCITSVKRERTSMSAKYEMFPVIVVQDRYSGVYSGHNWIALPAFDRDYDYHKDLVDGIWGDDVEAVEWCVDNKERYWGGDTPEEAESNLRRYYPSPQPHNNFSNGLI